MKLAVDVMGFENNINEAILACRDFQRHNKNVSFILVGKEDKINPLLKKSDGFVVHHANDIIKMDDDPMGALRKTNTSMYQAIQLVADNKADGVLSAGSTTVYVALVYYLLKLIPGINKPAFMPFLPTANGRGLTMLDVGANKTCNGKDLYQFAVMAKIYCQLIRNIFQPEIGIINIGTEDNKGFDYHQEAHQLLKQDKQLNYVGFVETRNLLKGEIDIAITDGYTGNITLKALEGGLLALKNAMKKEYHKFYN
jgi:glycerol-3-phosphate acyltransferase PlsX